MKKENIEQGIKITTQFNLKQMHEHFERLDKCGMPERRDRSKLYQDVRDGPRRRRKRRHQTELGLSIFPPRDGFLNPVPLPAWEGVRG